eukprot:1933705-Pleurochrysis_carterae.AAC.1
MQSSVQSTAQTPQYAAAQGAQHSLEGYDTCAAWRAVHLRYAIWRSNLEPCTSPYNFENQQGLFQAEY